MDEDYEITMRATDQASGVRVILTWEGQEPNEAIWKRIIASLENRFPELVAKEVEDEPLDETRPVSQMPQREYERMRNRQELKARRESGLRNQR
jgi:hypothetical protein